MRNLVLTQAASVRKINRPPVLKTKDFDAVSVFDLSPATGDPTTYFTADDNGRYDNTNAVPFVNGDKYYYFITALDILGRDGLVSLPVLVTACDRMPPFAPKNLKVINDYSFNGVTNKQVLKLIWDQNTNAPPDNTMAYYIYRWSSPDELNKLWPNPSNNLVKVIAHFNGQGTNSYVDDGVGAPTVAANAGQTFWYSIRAIDDGACDGGNLSGNSAPAWGVLRDRTGPGAPSGRIFTQCAKPTARFVRPASIQGPKPDTNYYHLQLICAAQNPGMAWAEFYLFDASANTLTLITRQHFLNGARVVQYDYSLLRAAVQQKPWTIYCRVADLYGEVSSFAAAAGFDPPPPTVTVQLFFEGDEQIFQVDATGPNARRDCDTHIPVPPGTTGITCITGLVTAVPKAKEWKIYRRVDDAPPTLIDQGFYPTNGWNDCAMPVNSGSLCYYAQVFDENGNASPFVLLGCLKVKGTGDLPIPVLSPLESTLGSTQLDPKMTIRWFCPPQPVERFQICITVINPPGTPMPDTISSMLSSNLGPSNFVVTVNAELRTNDFNLYPTPRVGPVIGNGPMYSVDVSIAGGNKYLVAVKAVGHDGGVGAPSNGEEFIWNPVTPSGPQVPWPARGLPPVSSALYSGPVSAQFLPPIVDSGVGVLIGQISGIRVQSGTKRPYLLPGVFNPLDYIWSNKVSGASLFPVAMYRYQTPNANYLKVSGDVIQVSPLMEKIAYEIAGGATRVHDPFIAMYSNDFNNVATQIFLLDTQPVVSGARYCYLLVRLDPVSKEIVEVVQSTDVDIP